jgi:hypothetical protein
MSDYFEKERGFPKQNEPIALTHDLKKPVNKPLLRSVFQTLTLRAGLKQKRDRGKLGVTIHEFRDTARSTLQLAKRDGFDVTCAEFWMGHKIDPLGYNKFTELSPDYVLENYKVAERHLNILSQTPAIETLVNEKIKQRDGKIASLEQQIKNLTEMYSVATEKTQELVRGLVRQGNLDNQAKIRALDERYGNIKKAFQYQHQII